MSSGAALSTPRRAAVTSPQRHRGHGDNPQCIAGDSLSTAVRCLFLLLFALASENPRQSAKSAANWFWLRPEAALGPLWLCGEDSCATKPISAMVPIGRSAFPGGDRAQQSQLARRKQQGEDISCETKPNLDEMGHLGDGSRRSLLCGTKPNGGSRLEDRGANKATWAKESRVGGQPPDGRHPAPDPWAFVRNKPNSGETQMKCN